MNRFSLLCLLLLQSLIAAAQGTVKGRVLDKQTNEPLGYVTVAITHKGQSKIVKGAITDENGTFTITDVADGNYTLVTSFTGYKTAQRDLSFSPNNRSRNFPAIYIAEDTHALDEVVVKGQRSDMKLEVDRKSFNVDQQISAAGGSASEALENIPSVEVDNDGNISLRGNSSVEVWINGKASGLTSDNRAEILKQLPAESIERIEVIDNPSAKFSAEGSAGIINIVLKKDRKAGYYGSVQMGGDTRGGANTSFNINYSSSAFDAYASIGYRHHKDVGGGLSQQTYQESNTYQNYDSEDRSQGNNLFTRAGLTWHPTKKDDIGVSGMFMLGGHSNSSLTPYHYGTLGAPQDTRLMSRLTRSSSSMRMFYGEFSYRHNFTDFHYLDFTVSADKWKSDEDNWYQDSTTYYDGTASEYDYQYRPMFINNRSYEVKLDYENPITEHFKLQAGYQGRFSKENTPQESWVDATTWDGQNVAEDKDYYNRFIYKNDVHALYATATTSWGNFGVMAGLRGEYWRVNTESYSWEQEHDPTKRDTPFKKDYFQLFPSIFLSYQITPTQQFQLNYTRRLRRPWGGQLNSFKNTRDATVISFGNPELTPEYSNSFSLNYLKTWTQHSLLISAYYRPTSDVMQRISYRSSSDGLMYQTNFNVANSLSTGLEMTAKNKLWRILDLTTSANFYYYKLDGFAFDIDGQTVNGEGQHNFTWNARMQASVALPYDISVQLTGRYRSRQAVTQGYRPSSGHIDLGIRKSFLDKMFTVSLSCRDLLNSRRWKTYTSSDTFTRYQENWRGSRKVNLTITWNFGNMKQKRSRQQQDQQDDDFSSRSGYGSME